ncbi:MAG: excinuclease ABC subunit A [Candidatus Moranbacteria bacterium RIFOXYC12_FULL_36_13]|nr:MAG: UvrABC system protein A [Candidatus Moranbacteria bacterium GW2011_GWF2_35_39]OGI32243.1 MAG: excinuclease ABC subunit A [Candidatus Moranbacteria bacterium RIFOXYB12_FULL_35_8]OGI33145.1 MAG: excinuclease ABC subunit A [Candidatus Moranbacteria bacterium RIFOXYC12_FULL_36_13]
MKRDKIKIVGARVNNLKNISVEIPRDKLVVITGLSGSGKSSLAFDVVNAEGNRRYLESLSSYARSFLEISAKPDADKIENLSPTISIDQKSISRSPRSTVGTMTEIYDYLRILFAKVGTPYCPHCRLPMARKKNNEIIEEILALPDNTQIAILARVRQDGKNIQEILKNASQLGYARARIDGKIISIAETLVNKEPIPNGNVEIVIDRITFKQKNPDKERILDSIETAFKLGKGFMAVSLDNGESRMYNRDFVCSNCFFKISEITPKHFSFNSPEGACSNCAGLGVIREIDEDSIVPNKNLSLSEGAVLPLSKLGGRIKNEGSYLDVLEKIGKKKGFSINDPLEKISRENLEIIFRGFEDEKENLHFPGVIFLIKQKYEDSSSFIFKKEIEKYMREIICPECLGKRLKKEFLSVLILGKSIDDVVKMDGDLFLDFLKKISGEIDSPVKKEIASPLIREMEEKAKALKNVGLEYLELFRSADSISGGEGQRIRLAAQISSELSGLIYVLDEPSIGLHNRDTQKLIQTMQFLRDNGNSLIVVEHDKEIIQKADWIIDMGPGAGEAGGEIIFQGDISKLKASKTKTAGFLNGLEKVSQKKKPREKSEKYLKILGATEHNLKNIDVEIPLARFVTITGVSGSGKSTLVSDILAKSLAKQFFRAKEIPGKYKKITGLNFIDKVINVDQSPIGRTPRSNAATYTGVFSLIRDIFASTSEAKNRGYDASRFSFNMKGGRCEDCQGDGTKKIEMHLLPDVYVKCETCLGTRYNQKTLDIEYQGVNIAEVLDMSVSYALMFFKKNPLIVEKLKTLEEVGLGYLKLGQSATNLSGGEAQRIKLASELSRKSTGKTLYILDEPTIGLHFEDIRKLLKVLDALVEKGNSVIVVEHNSDVIKNSDWVIDLGPEGGSGGGEIVYAGFPDGLKKCQRSWTGRYL